MEVPFLRSRESEEATAVSASAGSIDGVVVAGWLRKKSSWRIGGASRRFFVMGTRNGGENMELCSFEEEIMIRPGESMEIVVAMNGCKLAGIVDATTLAIVGGRLSHTFRVTVGPTDKIFELECPTRFDMMAWATQIKLHKAAEKRKVAEEIGVQTSLNAPQQDTDTPSSGHKSLPVMDISGSESITEISPPLRTLNQGQKRSALNFVPLQRTVPVKSVMHPFGMSPRTQVLKPERAKPGRRGDEGEASCSRPSVKLLESNVLDLTLSPNSTSMITYKQSNCDARSPPSTVRATRALFPQGRIARKDAIIHPLQYVSPTSQCAFSDRQLPGEQ